MGNYNNNTTNDDPNLHHYHEVNYAAPRSFGKILKSQCKETFFPDDPFRQFRSSENSWSRIKKGVQYFVPIFEWLPEYDFRSFRFDLLAGITITSLAIPQGISYAKLAELPPIIGLYSSFVPPLIYAVFGSSKHLAVGTVAACSLLIADTIGGQVSTRDNAMLYLHLVFTAAFFSGIFQTALGVLRLGILVDFLSHSTITGFMGGTAILICLQQLKGMLGLIHFTTKTDVVSVLRVIFKNRSEWRWQSALVGIIFLIFLQFTRYLEYHETDCRLKVSGIEMANSACQVEIETSKKRAHLIRPDQFLLRKRKPKLFWVSAMAPMVVVIIGCVFAYFTHAEKHGIQIVGLLHKGLNPISIQHLNFDSKYLPYTLKAGLITALVALAEGIAIGRSFAIMKNEQIDGNKEMIAFGLMNIIGSFTSCYLTTGPFSKTAVNFNSGCKTAMSNVVMSVCMMLTLLFLAPLFSYTPLVALSAIIMSAMFGLIKYKEMIKLYKVDKFDFIICMTAFLGVAFITMDYGLIMSIGLALLRALLYVARPASCKLGRIPDSALYRDIEQYPEGSKVLGGGVLALQLGSPLYYANCNYIRERIFRWIREEESSEGDDVQHLLLDLSGVTSVDMTGLETLIEVLRMLEAKDIKMHLINPRIEVMEKLMRSKFVDKIGKENIFLCVEVAIEATIFSLTKEKPDLTENGDDIA